MTDKRFLDQTEINVSNLKRLAEEKLSKSPDEIQNLGDETPEGIIHELRVHQIELEMQNDELKRVQLGLEESQDKYRNLYDFAPVGYFTLTNKGLITEVNLAGAALLGMARPKLIGRGFGRFVAPESLDQWEKHVLTVRGCEGKHSGVLTLNCEDGSSFYARLESIRTDSPAEPRGGYSNGHRIHTAVCDITEGKLAENALLLSENRFRSLFESMSNGVAIYRALKEGEDFIFLDFNEAAEKIERISRSQVIGRSVLDVFPGMREFGLFDVFQRVWRTGNPERYPIKEYKDNRIQGWKDNFVYKLPSGEIVAIYTDETRRIRSDEASRNCQRVLDFALKVADLGTWDLDMLTGHAVLNERAANIAGYRLDEITPTIDFWKSSLHPDDIPHTLRAFGDHLAGHTDSYEADYRVKTKSGEYKWVSARAKIVERDAGGRALRLIGVFEDITKRKQTEGQEKSLFKAIEQAADGIIITDPSGTIQYVNPAEEALTGYSRDELIGGKPSIFKTGKHNGKFYDDLWGAINSGRVWAGRFINKRKDGTEYHEDATISPVCDKSGNLTNFVAVKHDVTRHIELQAQLFQAQKMEAIGTLAGGFAHDFNNKLQVIGGYLDLILFNKDLAQTIKPDLEVIKQTVDSCAELINGMMVFSRKAPVELHPIRLNKLVAQASSILCRSIPKMIEIDLSLAEDLWTIRGDRTQIDQILVNLSLNARDAMRDGGKLFIRTQNTLLDEEFLRPYANAKPGRYVLLSVADTGAGMDYETLEHIFEPFFTTKEAGKGTGLGLSVVYGIVENHGGKIICDSEPSVGTTFRIYFPAIAGVSEDQRCEKTEPAKGQGETILVVDDEPSFISIISRTLNRSKYEVITASNGNEALELYEKNQEGIRLVVLDLIMPGMDGRECLQALRKMDPKVRVLVASGGLKPGMEEGLKDAGAIGFIAKPFDMPQLMETIRKIIDEE